MRCGERMDGGRGIRREGRRADGQLKVSLEIAFALRMHLIEFEFTSAGESYGCL